MEVLLQRSYNSKYQEILVQGDEEKKKKLIQQNGETKNSLMHIWSLNSDWDFTQVTVEKFT